MVIADNFIWLHLCKTGGTHIHRIFQVIPHLATHIDGQFEDDRSKLTSTFDSPEYRHDNIKKRQRKIPLSIEGKKIILNIRRLPDFLFSHHLSLLDISTKQYTTYNQKYYEIVRSVGKDHSQSRVHARILAMMKDSCKLLYNCVIDPDVLAKGRMSVISSWWFEDGSNNSNWITADDALRHYQGSHGIDYWLRMEELVDDFVITMRKISNLSAEDEEKIRLLPPSNINPLKKKYKSQFLACHIQQMYANNPLWMKIERELYGYALCDKI